MFRVLFCLSSLFFFFFDKRSSSSVTTKCTRRRTTTNDNNNKDFLYVKKEERRGWRRGRARCLRPEDEDSFRRFVVLFLEARTNAKNVDDAAFVSHILGRRRRSDFTAPLRDHVDVERPRRRHRHRRRARTTMVLYARRRRDGILECR